MDARQRAIWLTRVDVVVSEANESIEELDYDDVVGRCRVLDQIQRDVLALINETKG